MERKGFYREPLFKEIGSAGSEREMEVKETDFSKCFYRIPTPAVVKLVKLAREQKAELREARLAVNQLVRLIECLEEEIAEKDEIIVELKKGERNE